MSTTLIATSGRPQGSAASRRLRAEGNIPGVLYGHGMAPISLSVVRRELRLALSGSAGTNTVLDLTVDGKVYPALVKEIQRHPVKRNVTHVDFIQVNLNEEITIFVPLRLEGEAKAVIAAGGLVDPSVDTIEVVTTPRNIPDELVVDITDMQMDSVVRLSELALPAGVTATGDPDMPIVTVLVTRAAEAAEEAEAEAAEGAEGGGESGEAEAGE
jgi:large subunit ribosomal protein L25